MSLEIYRHGIALSECVNMSSTQRHLGPLALSALRVCGGNASLTSGGSRGGFARIMRGVGTIGGDGKEQDPERNRVKVRGRGRGRGKEKALETTRERGRGRSNSQQPGGIRDGENFGGGSKSGPRGGSGGRGAASSPRKSRGRGQGAFMSFLEPHRRKTDIESQGGDGDEIMAGRNKFQKKNREKKGGGRSGGPGGAARDQEFDEDDDAYEGHTDEFDDDSFRVPRHLAVPRKAATIDGEFNPWHSIGGDEYEEGEVDTRTWDGKVAEAWKRSTDKDDPDWDESDEDFHKMSYHYFKDPVQKTTVNGPRGKYELPSRRARSIVDLLQEFEMPEKLDIKPGNSEYETLKDAWVVVSRNPSMSRRSKNRLIKQMARFLHKNRESTELFEQMELPTLEEMRRRENMTYREKY